MTFGAGHRWQLSVLKRKPQKCTFLFLYIKHSGTSIIDHPWNARNELSELYGQLCIFDQLTIANFREKLFSTNLYRTLCTCILAMTSQSAPNKKCGKLDSSLAKMFLPYPWHWLWWGWFSVSLWIPMKYSSDLHHLMTSVQSYLIALNAADVTIHVQCLWRWLRGTQPLNCNLLLHIKDIYHY